jgi:hypothetical protein
MAEISDLNDGELFERLPTERGAAYVASMLKDFRRRSGKYHDNLNSSGAAYLITGLLTDAPSRKAASGRAFALTCALLEGGGACEITNEEFFGGAIVKLLTDQAACAQACAWHVFGDEGVAEIHFSQSRISRFQAKGPDFEPGKAIARWRSIAAEKLRVVVDALREAEQGRQ